GIIIDSELALQETDEESVPAFARLFDEDTWKKWKLKSGAVVADLLAKSAHKKGHPLRSEVWRIVRCGFKIAKPGWCSSENYSEIQKYTRRATISNRLEIISKFLRLVCLPFYARQGIEEVRLLNNINEIIKEEDIRKLLLEELKITCVIHQDVFGDAIRRIGIGLRRLCYSSFPEKCAFRFGKKLALSYLNHAVRDSFEQKADGVFFVRLKKSTVEVGHLEMSGGYGHKDLPRSTWDGCCKLSIGNAYMLEEIGERFRGVSCEHSQE
ncbi:13014_t:CDS:2, partial [Ambispora gerdemannii]